MRILFYFLVVAWRTEFFFLFLTSKEKELQGSVMKVIKENIYFISYGKNVIQNSFFLQLVYIPSKILRHKSILALKETTCVFQKKSNNCQNNVRSRPRSVSDHCQFPSILTKIDVKTSEDGVEGVDSLENTCVQF